MTTETHTATLTVHYETLGDAATPETLTSYIEALKGALERDDRVINYSVSHDDGDDYAEVTVDIAAADEDRAYRIAQQIDLDTYSHGKW